MANQTILVATLGGQPQIVTFTLDLLLARGEQIDQVLVVYLASNPRYYQAYRRLQEEFIADRYQGRSCHLRAIPIRASEAALADIETSAQVEFVHRTFYQLLGELKSHSHCLHLSLSGGRRMLALVALEAAMQYLAPSDHVWHLYTTPAFTEQARQDGLMHATTPGQTRLLEVPLVAWAAYFPGLKPLLQQTPQEGREAAGSWLSEAERSCCQQVWTALTPRQQEVLRAFAGGMTRAQAAAHLGVTLNTVDTHRQAILRQCQQIWPPVDGQEVDLHFIQPRFSLFLKGLARV